MEKIINRLIDEAVVNVDKYINNNSTWLIFTESKQWVIELTKDGTLWYNYNFFKNLFVYMSMDVVENQHYITKWVEDNIINGVKHLRHRKGADDSRAENIIQNGVKDIQNCGWSNQGGAEDTIQNGVKETELHKGNRPLVINDTIKNGVKRTSLYNINRSSSIEYTLQNGVKYTGGIGNPMWMGGKVEDTIQNGVKHIEYGDWLDGDERFDDIIQNGVKVTNKSLQVDGSCVIEDTIQNGIKETKGGGYLGSITMGGKLVHMVESPNQNNEVEDVIQHGVIETFDETHHRRREVVRTIRDGIKQTCAQIPSIDAVVERVVEEGIKQTIGEEYHHRSRIDSVIKNSIKEVQPLPAQDGNMDYSNYYYRQGDRTKPHTQYVNDVIENSIKETIL